MHIEGTPCETVSKNVLGQVAGSTFTKHWSDIKLYIKNSRGNQAYLLLFLSAFVFLTFVVVFSRITSAEPVQSPMGITSSFSESYFNYLYDDHFDRAIQDKKITTGGGGSVMQIGSPTAIQTTSTSISQKAYFETRKIWIDGDDYDRRGIYYIYLRFKPTSNNYYGYSRDDNQDGYYEIGSNFMVIDGKEFGLYLTGARYLKPRIACDPDGDTVDWSQGTIEQLTQNTWYNIEIISYDSQYSNFRWFRVRVNDQGWNEFGDNCVGLASSTYGFGDKDDSSDTSAPRGSGQWDYVNIEGHSDIECKFFDNFNDRATNWDVERFPESTAIWEAFSCTLHLESPGDSTCHGFTPYLDYIEDDGRYQIMFNFKFSSYYDNYILIGNNEIMLYISYGYLKYELDGILYPICELNPNTWYFIDIRRFSSNTFYPDGYYNVYINYIEKGGCLPLSNPGLASSQLLLGDYYTGQEIIDAYWDNIRVVADITLQTCGFSSLFLSESYFYTFFEDFEYFSAPDIEDTGWSTGPVPEGHANALWQVGIDSTLGSHTGQWVAKTLLNSNYPNYANGYICTPYIDLRHFSEAYLQFSINYNTFWGEDGLRVQYRIVNPETHTEGVVLDLGMDGGWYNCNDVDAWNQNKAFCGNSNGWLNKGLELPNEMLGHIVQIIFYFKANEEHPGIGVALDDIRILGKSNSYGTDTDFDDDELYNWEEFYTWGSSPLVADSDWDAMLDHEEISQYPITDLATLDVSYPDLLRKDIVVECDIMLDAYQIPILTAVMQNDLKDRVVGEFSGHGITLHLLFDQTLPHDIAVDKSDLDAIRDHPYFDKVNGIGHYCVFATDKDIIHINGRIFGWNWNEEYSDGVFVVYVKTCIEHGVDPDQEAVSKTFMHELGHNLGLYGYPQSPDDSAGWSPYYAGDYSMVESTNLLDYDYLGYLTEDSNRYFWWNGLSDAIRLYGWEYSYEDPWTVFPQYGLFYRSINDIL